MHGVTEELSSSCGCEEKFRGNSPVHRKLLAQLPNMVVLSAVGHSNTQKWAHKSANASPQRAQGQKSANTSPQRRKRVQKSASDALEGGPLRIIALEAEHPYSDASCTVSFFDNSASSMNRSQCISTTRRCGSSGRTRAPNIINNVQTRCIAKGEAQKGPLFWRSPGGLNLLRSTCSLGVPLEKP